MKCLTGKGAKAKAKLPSLHLFEEEHLYMPNLFLSFFRSVSLYAAEFFFVVFFFNDSLWENLVMEISTWLSSFLLYSWFISYSDQTVPCCDTTCFLPRDKLRLFWQINVLALHILCLLFYSEIFVIFVYLFIYHQFSSVVFDSLRLHESQHSRPPCPSPTPRVRPNSSASSQWCHPAISSSVVPFSCPNPSQHQGLFQWVNSSNEVVKVLEFQPQHQSF